MITSVELAAKVGIKRKTFNSYRNRGSLVLPKPDGFISKKAGRPIPCWKQENTKEFIEKYNRDIEKHTDTVKRLISKGVALTKICELLNITSYQLTKLRKKHNIVTLDTKKRRADRENKPESDSKIAAFDLAIMAFNKAVR